jgi:putative membrane protein
MRYSSLLPIVAGVSAFATPSYSALGQDMNPTSASDFVSMAAISDMYEIEAGKVAEAKGQSSGVKAFGRHMVAAHTETSTKLKAAVKKAGLNITQPAALDAKHQQLLDQLNSSATSDFDRTYISQQQDAHQDALKLVQTYASSGENSTLKKAASDTVPVIQDHIAMLGKLKAAR